MDLLVLICTIEIYNNCHWIGLKIRRFYQFTSLIKIKDNGIDICSLIIRIELNLNALN